MAGVDLGPPSSLLQTKDEDIPEFLRNLPPHPHMSQYPSFPVDKLASFGGHGTLEAKEVIRILEDAGIISCICGVGALMFYGAERVRSNREICVPSQLKERAEALLKSEKYASSYISLPPWPFPSSASLSHTYTRFKAAAVSFYFVLVPSNDIHLPPLDSQIFERSRPHGLPYPKLHVLIQSFLEANDHVSLADAIDRSDVSEEWGYENLDLDSGIDLEWAEWKNSLILEHGGRAFFCGLCSTQYVDKRELWQSIVRRKGGRRGWTQPHELFATRFRLHGSPPPWLEESDAC